jgi:acylphosphatase
MTVARRVRAHGRVQGVFFRETCRRQAESRGVSGWIANREDGTVEAVFEGEPDAVESMVEACRRGPGQARIDRLEVSDVAPVGHEGFDVR